MPELPESIAMPFNFAWDFLAVIRWLHVQLWMSNYKLLLFSSVAWRFVCGFRVEESCELNMHCSALIWLCSAIQLSGCVFAHHTHMSLLCTVERKLFVRHLCHEQKTPATHTHTQQWMKSDELECDVRGATFVSQFYICCCTWRFKLWKTFRMNSVWRNWLHNPNQVVRQQECRSANS